MQEINPRDLRVDIYRNSAMPDKRYKCGVDNVRITHLPSGIVVLCDSECLQHREDAVIDSRECAMNKLKDLMNAC